MFLIQLSLHDLLLEMAANGLRRWVEEEEVLL